MLFHTFDYAALLFLTVCAYWTLPRQDHRVAVLVVASLVFYGSWSVPLLSIIIATAVVDFNLAMGIERATDPHRRRWLLALSLGFSLGLLGFFKYTNFLIDTVWTVWPGDATGPRPHLALVLPLGISFYTFETVSYVVDVYRGRVRAERRFLHYLLFLAFFPHLIAGPIVRAWHFLPQIRRLSRLRWPRFYLGVRLFLLGLAKKAVVADQLAHLIDPVFAAPAAYGTLATWMALVAYAIQVYCDFSGYADMAIGSAHLFGIKLPQNFVRPYLAVSFTDMFRRWHVTLGHWLRDYVFVPLGGSRGGRWLTARNVALTMLVSGLWHGAAWTFVAWGGAAGLILIAHRYLPWPTGRTLGSRVAGTAGTLLLWVCCLVPFRAQNFGDVGLLLERMFVPTAGVAPAPMVLVLFVLGAAALFAAHLAGELGAGRAFVRMVPAPVAAATLGFAMLAIQLLMPDTSPPFIYFQF